MFKKIFLQLLIILVLLSGCSIAEENLDVKESVPETAKVVDVQNNEVSKIEESNSLKGNWIPEIPIEKVFLAINFGEDKIENFNIEFQSEMTVFDLLKNSTEQQDILLEIDTYSVGIFVTKIGNKKNGQDNKYWTYYVNDKFANVSADKFKLKVGDRVEWMFGKSKF